MAEAFRSLELVVMPVQAMFPTKAFKGQKRVQDMQDTLKCAPISKYPIAFNHGPHILVVTT